jgi:UDP-GlcNAc:undecaprenyl-phosphate GlcNAc-1-phosphate transferase
VIERLVGVALVTFLSGWIAKLVAERRLANHDARLVRTNVDGRPVPAVLGDALCAGTLCGLAAWAIWEVAVVGAYLGRRPPALAVIVVALWAAGRWDDLQGDERPRGFGGHLAAARSGRLTGGIVKLLIGGLAGLAAGALVASGWAVVEIGALVALSANLLNLLDRAPGRAGKIGLLFAYVLMFLGDGLILVPLTGALIGCLVFDLRAHAMLGDAGANPLGGAVGLALGLSLDRPGRLVALGVLVLLNALSEKFSFSRAIERVGFLRAFDRLGRDVEK